MSATDNGGPAFPRECSGEEHQFGPQSGMTLRDYFAAKALPQCQVLALEAAKGQRLEPAHYPARVVNAAYELADAMLAERSKP